MVSIIAWDKVHFLIFWTTTHYPTKLGQLIDLSKGNIFFKSFEWYGGLELKF